MDNVYFVLRIASMDLYSTVQYSTVQLVQCTVHRLNCRPSLSLQPRRMMSDVTFILLSQLYNLLASSVREAENSRISGICICGTEEFAIFFEVNNFRNQF